MLSPGKFSSSDNPWTDAGQELVDFDRLFAVFRRQWRLVAVVVLAFFLFGLAYRITAVPMYTATASVLIDNGAADVANQLSTLNMSGIVDDEPTVLSQVEVLKSDTIALAVVDNLKLTENPYFAGSSASLKSLIRSFLNTKNWFADAEVTTPDPQQVRENAAAALQAGMEVQRIGRTYVLQISYTSPSPDLASAIANGISNAYLLDKLNSKYDATKRASDWLQQRIEELRQNALDSDLAVQKFRAQNGLIASGTGGLVSDQQLSQLNSVMIEAQADTAKAQAKYDRVQSIIASGQTDAIVADALDSSTITDLRGKYLVASKLQAEIASRLGPNHERAVRLRAEMAEYERLMFGELQRIAESYKSELDVAKARERSLVESVAASTGIAAAAGETQVQLRELERTRDTYRTLYESFMTRLQEATQQQTFPVSNARVISPATIPNRPSAPKTTIVLAIAVLLGGMVGVGLASVREFRDRFFRTGDQVREELKLEYLGIAPAVAAERKPATPPSGMRDRVTASGGVTSYVVNHPLSVFAETMRSGKLAVDIEKPGRGCVIGVVSSLPGEGKSSIACNFAQLLAMQGARTLLIDGDLRNPGATRYLGAHAKEGFLEAVLESKPLGDLLLFDDKTKLAFLPAVIKRRVPNSAELLGSHAMRTLLDTAQKHFDYVIVDLPPLGPVVDARAIGPLLDSLILVVEWGKTSRKVVRSTVFNNGDLFEKCAGVVLNKVDAKKMRLYRSYGSSEYYFSRYASYYHE
ncbi:polysaccharide biosynthesis tyrosine autokinase [Rhizobium sp.]|uniref:polysaccharide biosynthesis tyrosine autokinase n=1 Tax=Rhizobium sp. TaxID=391 RepID=UPI0028A901E6